MSYRIKYTPFDGDETLVYDPVLANQDDRYKLIKATETRQVGGASKASLTVPVMNTAGMSIGVMEGLVTITDGDETVFIGRCRGRSKDFKMNRVLTLEGGLAFLNDSLQSPYAFPDDYLNNASYQQAAASGNVVDWWLRHLITAHNSQAYRPELKLVVGTVTVTAPNNRFSAKSPSYKNTFKCIEADLVGQLGGYLIERFEGGAVYVDYLDTLPEGAYSVEFGESLLDLTDEETADAYYNIVTATGKSGLTLAGLADGTYSGYRKLGSYLINQAEREARGGINVSINHPEAETTSMLLNCAIADLNRMNGIPRTITAGAVELGVVDPQRSDRLAWGTSIRVHSSPHGLDVAMPLCKQEINILQPAETKNTLGGLKPTISRVAAGR